MKETSYFQDKVVLITGGSQGIGRELAGQVLAAGGKVGLTGRSLEKLRQAQGEFQEYGANVFIRVEDVRDSHQAEPLVQAVKAHFGSLDILINNAGLSGIGEVEQLSQLAVDTIIDTNIKGSLYLSRAAIPELEPGGAILFVSSLAGLRGLPGHTLYSLTKMALTALAEGLAIELKPRRIFVGIAYVGFTANVAGKEWLTSSGDPETLPARDPRLVTSREATARLILKQIAARRPVVVHSWLGKLTAVLTRIFPGIVRLVLETRYHASAKHDRGQMF